MGLLNTCIATIARGNELTAGIMLAINKSTMLAYLSYVRSHCAQGEFNCRQLIEYFCLQSYFLAHPDTPIMRDMEDGSTEFINNKVISQKAHRWIKKSLPEISDDLLQHKEAMNASFLHACVYGTSLTMSYEPSNNIYSGSFFDNVEADGLRAGLLRLCRVIALGLSATYQANQIHSVIEFHDEIGPRLERYAEIVDRYQNEWREKMEVGATKLG